MIYLDVQELLHTAERVLGTVEIRDIGLLESAAVRPQATAFGEDAYATLHETAAALMHSIARNHALVDGNKPLALAGGIAFLGMNAQRRVPLSIGLSGMNGFVPTFGRRPTAPRDRPANPQG